MPKIHPSGPYKAALYARKQFLNLYYKETDPSAVTKIKEMQEYLKQKTDIQITGVYMDAHACNSDHPLPKFHQMLREIEQGSYTCIVMYRLDTFGRTAAQNRDFLLKRFPSMQIRILSMHDQYDSNTSEPDPEKRQVLDALLTQYEEKEKAARSSLQPERLLHMQPRSPINIPYGYRFAPDRAERIAIDPETEATVHMIFDLYLGGKTLVQIADILNAQGIAGPLLRKKQLGVRFQRPNLLDCWTGENIRHILSHRIYVGDYCFGRRQAASDLLDAEQLQETNIEKENGMYILPDHHEPIITREQFALVRQRLQQTTRPYQRKKKPSKTPKASASSTRLCVICGECDRAMVRKEQVIQGRSFFSYRCSSQEYDLKDACPNREYPEEELVFKVQDALNKEQALAKSIQTRFTQWKEQGFLLRLDASFHEKLRAILLQEQKNAALLSALSPADKKQADVLKISNEALRRRLLRLIEQRQFIRQMCNQENPWLRLFAGLPDPCSLTSSVAKKCIVKIVLYAYGTVQIHFAGESERKQLLLALSMIEQENKLSRQNPKGGLLIDESNHQPNKPNTGSQPCTS